MAKMTVEVSSLTTVADAIRAKKGTTDPLTFPEGFVTAIGEIKGGIDLTPYVSDLLTEVTEDMLAGCTYLCVAAFSVHKKLVKVSLPDTITLMEREIFYECSNLKEVKLPKDITKIPIKCFSKTSIERLTVPDAVTIIDDSAFENCTKLVELILPDSITKIFGYSISACTKLESIRLPDSLITLDHDVFKNSRNLKSVNIPPKITRINQGTFYGTGFIEFTIPAQVNYIAKDAFYDSRSLSRVILEPTTPPTALTGIFGACTSLTEIVVPKGTLSAYQSATNWSPYADLMVEASE